MQEPPVIDPTEGAPPRRSGRWLRVILFVSLALNLLILGVVGGAMLSRRGDARTRDVSLVRDLGLGPFLWALAPGDREALRRAAQGQAERLRGRRDEMRAAFGETLAALRADPFDAEGFGQLIERQAQSADKGRELGQQLLVQTLAGMSVADRQALADRLEEAVRRHGKRPDR